LKAHHSRLLATIVTSLLALVFQSSSLGNPQTKYTESKQVEVRLIPKRKAIKAGEALEVRVEIWNVGRRPVFITKAIFDLCGVSPLSLRLELGPPIKPQPGHGCASDCIYNGEDSFARRLVDHWTTLPSGDFYGTIVVMDPDSFPQLNTPGRWRLRGTYQSTRDLSSSLCLDPAPLPDNNEQIKRLPYEAWQGAVNTNTVWIVVCAGSSAMVNKSR
jgi:hypothetical protein